MENATTIVLREGVLNDDKMLVADEGYHFGNNPRHTVCVKYYTYANEWSNRENHFFATNVENAIKRYEKICGKLSDEEMETVETCLGCLC